MQFYQKESHFKLFGEGRRMWLSMIGWVGDWIELFAQLRAHLGGLCQPICEYKLVVKVTFSFQFNLFPSIIQLNINRKDFLMCF